jgi:hypothetical protein
LKPIPPDPVLMLRALGVVAAVTAVLASPAGSAPRDLVSHGAEPHRVLSAAAPAPRGPARGRGAQERRVAVARRAPAAGSAGVRVAIDPETGELGLPSPEQARALSAAEATALSRSSVGLHQVFFPDGTVMIDLQGRFMDYLVARRDASGRLRVGCANDAAGIRHLLRERGAVPAPAEEK